MPSNTTPLLEPDDTEPDLPVPNLYGLSLLDDDEPPGSRDTPHLGAVLELRPLSRTGSEEENQAEPVPGVMAMMMMVQEGDRCVLNTRRKSVNTTECVMVPTSEHVAEIVGRQGCKIKALRAKTNTYIKTPVRGEDPVFVVTGRREDVSSAKREIQSAAQHFTLIRASRSKSSALPAAPGHTSIQVRVPYRMVGLVVGPKGATIRRIQQQTHTYILTPGRHTEPVFQVSGMPENVERARDEIQAHIALRTARCPEARPDPDDFLHNGTDGGAWLYGARHSSSSSLGSSSGDSHLGGAAELGPWLGGVVQERGGASLPATPRLSPIDLVRLGRDNSPSLSAFSHDM